MQTVPTRCDTDVPAPDPADVAEAVELAARLRPSPVLASKARRLIGLALDVDRQARDLAAGMKALKPLAAAAAVEAATAAGEYDPQQDADGYAGEAQRDCWWLLGGSVLPDLAGIAASYLLDVTGATVVPRPQPGPLEDDYRTTGLRIIAGLDAVSDDDEDPPEPPPTAAPSVVAVMPAEPDDFVQTESGNHCSSR